MGLSAVIITYNEEINIEQCLKSLSFADEIVILDSYSTDRTVEIARKYTDKISFRKFTGFSDQKNALLKLASNEWILVVDADEVVSEELAQEIIDAVKNGEQDAYQIPRLTYFVGRKMRHCGWYPDYQLRLVRSSKAFFPDRLVHETLEVDGPIGTLKHDLIHYSYRNMNDYTRKMVLYARSAARQKYIEGRRFRLGDLLLNPGLTFFKMYILKQGFRDGLHGLVLSVLTACSSALRYAILWSMGTQQQETGEIK